MVDTRQPPVTQPNARRDDTVAAPAGDVGVGGQEMAKEQKSALQSESRGFFERFKDGYNAHLKQWRKKAIEITPSFIVNHSSNVIGAMHVGTEMMMFKSAMPEGKGLIKNPGNPINWIKEPIHTVFSETFHAARAEHLGDLFKGNVVKNVWHRISNMEAAAERYRQRPEFTGKLGNPWQFRTTFAGLVAWTISTIIPEKKESDEEIERMSIKRRVNPVGYVAERFKQALWVPEWHKHKRQVMGLCYFLVGICSTIGSWRGRTKAGDQYTLNWGYLGTSIISFLSAFPLMFASDEQRGYGGFGNIMLGRIPFLAKSIHQKYRDGDAGRNWYTFSSLSFQVENMLLTLIGGAQKNVRSDGTIEIVDHEAIRETAKEKAMQLKMTKSNGKETTNIPHDSITDGNTPHPNAKISAVSDASRAMPDRVAAQQAAAAEQTPMAAHA